MKESRPPVVFVENKIVVCVGGAVVGIVGATFDLSSLPPHLHGMALPIIHQGSEICLSPARAHMFFPDHYPEPPPEPRWTPYRALVAWWRKLRGRTRDS